MVELWCGWDRTLPAGVVVLKVCPVTCELAAGLGMAAVGLGLWRAMLLVGLTWSWAWPHLVVVRARLGPWRWKVRAVAGPLSVALWWAAPAPPKAAA